MAETTAKGPKGTRLWGLTIVKGVGATQTGALSIHGVLALASGNFSANG